MKLKGHAVCGTRVSGSVVKISAGEAALPPEGEGLVAVACGRCDEAFTAHVLSASDRLRERRCAFVICIPDSAAETAFAHANITTVSSFDSAMFLDGDRVEVDGEEGTVDVENVAEKHVVSCVVMNGDSMLILKRSDRVGSFQGKWSSVTGYVEEGETPVQTAFKEMKEEISVSAPVLLRQGRAVAVRRGNTAWISHPFLFTLREGTEVKIDWERTDYTWISRGDLSNYDTVPGISGNLVSLGVSRGPFNSTNF